MRNADHYTLTRDHIDGIIKHNRRLLEVADERYYSGRIAAYRAGRERVLIITEGMGEDTADLYDLTLGEKAYDAARRAIGDALGSIIAYSPDPRLTAYAWGVADPEEDAEAFEAKEEEEAIILRREYCWVADERGEAMIFPTRAAAQAWIEGAEDGIYELSHGESGRPSYYILPAEWEGLFFER